MTSKQDLDRRLRIIEVRLGILAPSPAAKPQPPAERGTVAGEAEHLRRMTTPPGVVSPHVRSNLDALAAWTNPDHWNVVGAPEEAARTRAMLDHLHGLVMRAMAGEDVPWPGAS